MIEGRRVLPIGRNPLVLEYNWGSLSKSSRKPLAICLSITLLVLLTVAGVAIYHELDVPIDITRESVCKQDFSALEISLDSFWLDVGRYPTDKEGLSALLQAPSGTESRWHGPYIKPREVRDPWGRPFIYHALRKAPDENYRLVSCGPDGIEDTADDLVNFDMTAP